MKAKFPTLIIAVFVLSATLSFGQSCQESREELISHLAFPVTNMAYSPQTDAFAYEILKEGKYVTIYKGKESDPFFPSERLLETSRLLFSPNGKRFVFIGRTAWAGPDHGHKDTKWVVVLDGKKQGEYASIKEPVFSKDSKYFSYIAWKTDREIVVENGQEKNFDYNFISNLHYEGDNLVFNGFKFGGHHFLNKNGKETKLECPANDQCTWDDEGHIVVSQRRFYDKKGDATGEAVYFKGGQSSVYGSVMNLAVSDSGKKYAFTAANTQTSTLFPVINGKPSPITLNVDFDCCGEGGHWFEMWSFDGYTFSPDDSHVAFIRRDDDKVTVFLDDREIGDAYDSGNLTFLGNRLAYITKTPDSKYVVAADNFKSDSFNEVSDLYIQGDAYIYLSYSESTKSISKSKLVCH